MKRESPQLKAEEQALAGSLRETLDRAAERHDPMLDAALAATRAQALSVHKPRWAHPWLLAGGMALAATLVIVVMLPGLRAPASSSVSVVNLAAAPPVDPQMLEDMDLLLALDEEKNGS